jgi:hypothetical protein
MAPTATAGKKKADQNGKKARAAKATVKGEVERITITEPNLISATFNIVGTSPLVQNKFSKKALETMRATQEAGSTAKKGRTREPKDFSGLFEGSIHRAKEGWAGLPANGIRAACVSACRTVGFKMTLAKLSIFIEADGFDATEGTPLVKITEGEPYHVEHAVRIQQTTDIRVRAMWDPGWKATIRVTFDSDQFTVNDVANLLMRVGRQVGLGEGRADSRSSAGMGWGFFDLVRE